jgi:hypothetical protein
MKKPSSLFVFGLVGMLSSVAIAVVESVVTIKNYKDRDRLNVVHARECGRAVADRMQEIADDSEKKQA